MHMEKTENLRKLVVERKGSGYWVHKKHRTAQGVVFVAFGLMVCLGSFVLGIIMALGDQELAKWPILFLMAGLVAGVIMAVFGASFWSTEVVHSVAEDLGTAATGIFTPWRRRRRGPPDDDD